MPLIRQTSLIRITFRHLIPEFRGMAVLLTALVYLNPALVAAIAKSETLVTSAESNRSFAPFVAGIWETLPAADGSPQSACIELRPDGTGTMVIRIKLPAGERTVVSRITWSVASGTTPGETVLRVRHIRSTEPALNPGPTTESTILEANRLTLKTQTRREEPQTLVRRELLPPEVSTVIAKANLPETTTKESPIK